MTRQQLFIPLSLVFISNLFGYSLSYAQSLSDVAKRQAGPFFSPCGPGMGGCAPPAACVANACACPSSAVYSPAIGCAPPMPVAALPPPPPPPMPAGRLIPQAFPGSPCEPGVECTGGSVCSMGICLCPPELVQEGTVCVSRTIYGVVPPVPPPVPVMPPPPPAPAFAAPYPQPIPAAFPFRAPMFAPPPAEFVDDLGLQWTYPIGHLNKTNK
ncbi:EB module domain-containing protein [Ditylenchus destructor]|uniref:EB module domain-containing protein n=1 Tax=Ditylenchus destructor TaxID=166010 RepID=A0AAD4RDY5_9BILA|nr:EB module domain-containing protein [Ditylenchus destructor]